MKDDYESLQDKFDKNMKAVNNINMDLKEEMDKRVHLISMIYPGYFIKVFHVFLYILDDGLWSSRPGRQM